MKRTSSWMIAAFFVALTPSAAAAVTGASAGPSDLQSLLDRRVAGAPGVGIVAGVVDHGGVRIYQSGSSGTNTALNSHTLFEIGSVTKTFTATLLSTMVLDGLVKLDDPVSQYLPARVHVPARNGKQITLFDLATQHSGLPRMPSNMDPGGSDPYAHYSINDLYAFLNSYTLTRDPGQSFEYSNLGVALLGDALANRAHMSYDRLLRTRILDPLGMRETAMTLSPAEQIRFAAGHDVDNHSVASWNFEAMAPAGAIRSTAADMLKFVRCNMGRGPLAKACLFAQQPRSTFPGNRIGLVWWTGDVKAIIHHGGDTAGYHASVAISPDHTSGVVVLTNGGAPVDDVAAHVIDPTLPVAMTEYPPVVTLSAATLDSYVGMYTDKAAGLTFAIRRIGDTMTVQLTGQPQARIYPSAKDAFYLRVVDARIDFSRATDGSVSGLVVHQGGQNAIAARTGAVAETPTEAPSPAGSATASPTDVAPENLDEYVGTYDTGQGLSFIVTRSSTHLMVQLTGQPSAPVYESAKDKFYYKVVDAQVEFVRDAGGKIAKLVLHQYGNTITAARSGIALPQPSFPPVATLDSATLDSYVGTYVASPGAAFTVTRTGDQVMIQLTGQASIPVYPSAKDAFYYKIVDATVTFVRDASGKVTQLILHQNGQDIPAVRS